MPKHRCFSQPPVRMPGLTLTLSAPCVELLSNGFLYSCSCWQFLTRTLAASPSSPHTEMDIEVCVFARTFILKEMSNIRTRSRHSTHCDERGAVKKCVGSHLRTHTHCSMVRFILTMWSDTFSAFCSSDVSPQDGSGSLLWFCQVLQSAFLLVLGKQLLCYRVLFHF